MFAKPGVYEPCNIYTVGHLILVIVTLSLVAFALHKTKHFNKEQVLKTIRILAVVIWLLEIIKISFVFSINRIDEVKEWVPLYYCSILLYATLLSGFGNNFLKKVGDTFLEMGAIIGGVIFIFCPTTSLPTYPIFHFISLHSFFYHGVMIYLGLLVNITNYHKSRLKDIKYFSNLILTICSFALIVNYEFDSNLMFISKNFPGTPVEYVFHITGEGFFTAVMIAAQMTLPFITVYLIKYLINKKCSK